MKKSKQEFENFKKSFDQLNKLVIALSGLVGVVVIASIILLTNPNLLLFVGSEAEVSGAVAIAVVDESEGIENGIHIATGFIDAPGMMITIQNCTNCHSSKLVIQNRMNEESWVKTIRWMQETQNLWDLGENEKVIVDYLVTNYPPKKVGRRANLEVTEWYELE
ncbi:MAG: hypothetical protein ACI9UV_001607 [Algoriphagus sp.]|jgi:hypothetical protein